MTSFTRSWSAAYEAQPADNEDISSGAGRIRNLKVDLKERLQVDHSHAGDLDDGKHKQLTFVNPLGADPGDIADEGILYTKDVSGVVELFWKDESGNVAQLTASGSLNAFTIPAGTKMLFAQTTPPAGWTKDTTHNNKALRVVTGTVGSGGATAFTSVFGSGKATSGTVSTGTVGGTAITEAQMPAHTHPGGATLETRLDAGTGAVGITGDATGSTGGGATHTHSLAMNSHTHGLSLDLQYADVIIATKD